MLVTHLKWILLKAACCCDTPNGSSGGIGACMMPVSHAFICFLSRAAALSDASCGSFHIFTFGELHTGKLRPFGEPMTGTLGKDTHLKKILLKAACCWGILNG
jgi:hypothetical protein